MAIGLHFRLLCSQNSLEMLEAVMQPSSITSDWDCLMRRGKLAKSSIGRNPGLFLKKWKFSAFLKLQALY
ncbi:hypothetical protein O6P43_033982 [Quillaja saponaria]|uniref:Uncharacterized protein n=1 Tax=Quillaja saponaria TaxID=32244 RepID=A0AAD7KRY2_QUISA|nr:hypothetical protein O6P43_033982 [Quillaja saponaria]